MTFSGKYGKLRQKKMMQVWNDFERFWGARANEAFTVLHKTRRAPRW